MVYVITGANRGIGLELCPQVKERGDEVVAVCRHRSADLDKLGARVIDGVDVRNLDDVRRLREQLDGTKIDVLINVAGILSNQQLGKIDEPAIEAIRAQFEVNALGPVLVTQALMDLLHKGSKVGIITSRMGSIADNGSGGSYGYRMSKAAVNAAGKSLAIDLEPRGISVVLLHPGYVRTDMTGGSGGIDPEEAARGLLARLDDLSLETTGSFWHQNGEQLPW
ncbi:MAG TPA: SDR family oxidoreductase [Gammaproteobacteria bacterium]|nr:SDR family oxidoreductase [Gammaproteobacteria bacterium]